MSDEVAIRLTNVSKYYKLYKDPKYRLIEALHPFNKKYHKKYFALNNIDLAIQRGEILGIVGKNGSGKSTLLKIISRVLSPNNGTVKVRGKISALLELGAGFNPEFTGLKNIHFYCTVLGLNKREVTGYIDQIIDFADIGEFINQPLKTYSSGMKARLSFAVAVHIEPEILILDEVLSVGDALFRRKCYAKMEEFFKKGKTIIYVSHDANTVNKICSRAVLLHEGEIILDSDARTVTKYYEKMIFSKNEHVNDVIEEIAEQTLDKNPAKQLNHHINLTESNPRKVFSNLSQAYYIDNFKPQSTLVYQDYDIKIFDPHILTPEGERVNVLVTGREYIYCYTVRFEVDAVNVSYGMMIKDEKGAVLSGAGTHLENKYISVVKKGETHSIKWKFVCHLLQGVYYTNAGVSTTQNGELSFLTRLVDAAVFKVGGDKKTMVHGLIDLELKVQIEMA